MRAYGPRVQRLGYPARTPVAAGKAGSDRRSALASLGHVHPLFQHIGHQSRHVVTSMDAAPCGCLPFLPQPTFVQHLSMIGGACRGRRPSCDRLTIVDCWIGVAQEQGRRVVRLAGRLAEAQVPELLMACSAPEPTHLDLSDLMSVDAAGLDALHRVEARGTILISVPGYIRLQLEAPSRARRPRAAGRR